MAQNTGAESIVRDIKRRTRRKYSSEEKIRIVLEGLRGESSVAEICRREGLNTNIYYKWSKEFLEAGKKRLQGDTVREATSTEVSESLAGAGIFWAAFWMTSPVTSLPGSCSRRWRPRMSRSSSIWLSRRPAFRRSQSSIVPGCSRTMAQRMSRES